MEGNLLRLSARGPSFSALEAAARLADAHKLYQQHVKAGWPPRAEYRYPSGNADKRRQARRHGSLQQSGKNRPDFEPDAFSVNLAMPGIF